MVQHTISGNPSPTDDNVEVQICGDQDTDYDEDVPFEFYMQ